MHENNTSLAGIRALVTSGPTFEPIDPVRYIGNRSSGKQGFAIAEELARRGADVFVIAGPCTAPEPLNCKITRVETARDMLDACKAAGSVDLAICVAAVADYRVENVSISKIRKEDSRSPTLYLVENPDILKWISREANPRPRLVIGFAGETEDVLERALKKRIRKGCDILVANDVSTEVGTFGSDSNKVWFIDDSGSQQWPPMSKREVAACLIDRVVFRLQQAHSA